MKTAMTFCACLVFAAGALAQTGQSQPQVMDKSHCERMMKEHMGAMGQGHEGMKGKQEGAGKDRGMISGNMPKECMDMMGGMAGEKMAKATTHKGVATVKSVDASAGTVTLSHEPIQSIGWPAMTMPFTVRDKSALSKLQPGQKVEFDFVQEGRKSVVTSIR